MTLSRLSSYLIAIVVILMIPFIAMQLTDEVDWSTNDFIIAAFLLCTFAIIYEIMRTMVTTKQKRRIGLGILVALLILIWAEMAVGIFGSPLAGS